nr:AAA family ATPase [uncultured Bacteroides sp.]
MNIFFGKISQKFDVNQITEGYYQAEQNSSWFGELKIGDYVYLIGGTKIQFWQANKWDVVDGKERLYFKILNNDLGIGVNDFIALNMFRLTKPLLVLTSRSARNKAFFKLDIIQQYRLEDLTDSKFYKNEDLYRKIEIKDQSNIDNASHNIQLYRQNNELKVLNSFFFSNDVFELFRDNLNFQGNGQIRKDTTLKAISTGLQNGKNKFSASEIGLRSFYDAFFCDYKENDSVEIETEEEKTEGQSALKSENSIAEAIKLLNLKKNLIVQGAPGTGKTYIVPEIAVNLCNSESFGAERESIISQYKQLVDEKRVVFCTFHPSMDYEEFVEGIKTEIENGQVNYITSPGIFRRICEEAEKPIIIDANVGINKNSTIWKVSLMGTYDNYIRKDCLENNRIRIGWDSYGPNLQDDNKYEYGGRIVLDAFVNKMQIGDVVFSCYTNRIIDAIGVVTSEYEFDDSLGEYCRVRKVNWLVKGIHEDIFDLNNQTNMTLSTVYRLNNITLDKVFLLLEKYGYSTKNKVEKNYKPYVLIIDEINRGNISKIFGELITLLESDKRSDGDNSIKVTLPYSNTKFEVPSNLYIIGTMNTTDRSVGHIDYAVRRRFAFYTLKSNKEAIDSYYNLIKDSKTVRLTALELFDKVNDYIESKKSPDLDIEDLMIGHSYFMAEKWEDLKTKLEYEIIPLIREYEKDGIITLSADERKNLGKEWKALIN